MQGLEWPSTHAFPTFDARYDDVVAPEFALACIRRHAFGDVRELVDDDELGFTTPLPNAAAHSLPTNDHPPRASCAGRVME